MAESKKSIIVYADWIEKFEELSDDEAGRLIKHFFRYVNDLNPIAPDRTTKLMFIDIQNHLKRDLNKWEIIKEKRSEAGKASAASKKAAKEKQQKTTNSTSVKTEQQDLTKSTVNVNVNDNVNVSVNNIVVEEVITDEEKIEEICTAVDYLEETQNLPADYAIDEEEYAAAEKFLKSQSFFNVIQMHQKVSADEALKLFRIFYEQKSAFDELKNHRTPMDLIKNFFYWIPKYNKSLIDNKPNDATPKPNGNTVTGQFTHKNNTADQNRTERGKLGEIARNVVLNTGP